MTSHIPSLDDILETIPIRVGSNTQFDTEVNVSESAEFYTQRSELGENAQGHEVDLLWTFIKLEEAQRLKEFFAERHRVRVFTFTLWGEDTPRTWRAISAFRGPTPQGSTHYTVSIRIKEEFGL